MKELLLREIKRRSLDIEFDDTDIKWLEEAVLCTGKTETDIINEFLDYYENNYK